MGEGLRRKVNYTLDVPPTDNDLVSQFELWLLSRVSPETARDYVSVVRREVWPPSRRCHVKAWRQYVQYLFSVGRVTWEERMRYLEFLRLPKQKRRTQEEVPINIIEEYGKLFIEYNLTSLYLVLLGGARLKHVVIMFNEWRPDERVKHPTDRFEARLTCTDSFCRYYLGYREGSKRVDYIYFPRAGLTPIKLNYQSLRNKLYKNGINVNMFRKFANQTLEKLAHEHNIRLDAVNLIMSRELSVTGEHYLNTRDWADKLFTIYVREVIKPMTNNLGEG